MTSTYQYDRFMSRFGKPFTRDLAKIKRKGAISRLKAKFNLEANCYDTAQKYSILDTKRRLKQLTDRLLIRKVTEDDKKNAKLIQ